MFPRWLTWMFLLVMGYMIYAASRPSAVVMPAQPMMVPAITAENYPALAEATDVERWKRALDPHYAARMNCTLDKAKTAAGLTLKIIEDATGEGTGAVCGDTITIHLTVWNAMGGKAYDGTLPLALGSRQLASGLDVGLLGIKPGGVRTLTLPPIALARQAKSTAPAAAKKSLPANALLVVTVTRVK